MYLDMTFRYEIPDNVFPDIQVMLADCANEVQSDCWLPSTVYIPRNRQDDLPVMAKGYLVGVEQYHAPAPEPAQQA